VCQYFQIEDNSKQILFSRAMNLSEPEAANCRYCIWQTHQQFLSHQHSCLRNLPRGQMSLLESYLTQLEVWILWWHTVFTGSHTDHIYIVSKLKFHTHKKNPRIS